MKNKSRYYNQIVHAYDEYGEYYELFQIIFELTNWFKWKIHCKILQLWKFKKTS